MRTSLICVLFVMIYLVVCSSGRKTSNWIGPNADDNSCSKEDITVNQSPGKPLPNGIPTYDVVILNECTGNRCNIGNIHLSCGMFSSTKLVDPRIFRRLSDNDCLVNDAQPLASGKTLSFSYSNTFSYPLSVSRVTCL